MYTNLNGARQQPTRASGFLPMLFAGAILQNWSLAADTYPSESKAAPDGALEEIVVTAQKREQSLQDVGISVTALSGTRLQQLGFSNATDIAKQVPAVSIYQIHPSVTDVNIRGVSQNYFADSLEAPIATYVDEAYLGSTSAIGVQMFDIARVEVLRGPQGTLFGRNATGGLIHYLSHAPTDAPEAYVQVTAGNQRLLQTEGAISGPLTDRLKARFSFATTHDDGPYSNSVGLAPGNTRSFAARLQIEADPSDATKARLILSGSKDGPVRGAPYSVIPAVPNAQGLGVALGPNQIGTWVNLSDPTFSSTVRSPCPGCDLTGYRRGEDPFKLDTNSPGYFSRTIGSITLKIDHEFGAIDFSSISNYQNIDKSFVLNSSGGPTFLFDYGTGMSYHQFSQELRASTHGDLGNMVGGLYYLNMDGHYNVFGPFDLGPYVGAGCTSPGCTSGSSALTDVFRNDYTLRVKSYAPFIQGDLNLTSNTFLTLGVRYTNDRKTFKYHWGDDFGFQRAFGFASPTIDYADGRSFVNMSAKAQFNWHPMDDWLLYAGWSRGTKGGNWSVPIFPPIEVGTLPHHQEVLNSYEIGSKKEFWGGRAVLNLSAFHYNYQGYQAFAIVTLVQKIFNVDARIDGGEAEFRIAPVKGLELSVSAATAHGIAKNVPLPLGGEADRDMPNTQRISGSALARYEWPAFGGNLFLQSSFQYTGPHYLTVLNAPVDYERASAAADFRGGFRSPDGTWEFTAWTKNAFDRFYRVWALDVSSLGYAAGIYGPPRTFGGTVRYKFH
jgi:iron complex outermembrane receptor protein